MVNPNAGLTYTIQRFCREVKIKSDQHRMHAEASATVASSDMVDNRRSPAGATNTCSLPEYQMIPAAHGG